MSIPEDHKGFLAKKDYTLGWAERSGLSRTDYLLLSKYGHWLEALSSRLISPLTPEQSRFIDVSNGTQEPISEFEIAFYNLQLIRTKERTPLFSPPSPSTFKYFPCAVCGVIGTLRGDPCVKCRLKSGEIVESKSCDQIKPASVTYTKPTYGYGKDNWDYSAIK